MPLFEFTCCDCETDFEELIFGDEKPTCPSCRTTHVEKRLSVPAPGRVATSLPVCQPEQIPQGGCGLPQCGQGACGME
ncbi:MAG: zinc ribbon domain-containing protein [Pirellulales bacterium]|nr:zinc ribbon domain-containing protein [Pirellulales bacterium]